MDANLKTSGLKRYPAYKHSGVDWIGEIPEHWVIVRLGTKFLERRIKVSDTEFPALSVTKLGILPQLDSAAKTNDGDNRKLVKSGDFVINSRSDRKGSSGIACADGSVSLINIVLGPLDIHLVFCNYLLKCNGFIEEFYRIGHGIVADLWTTRFDEMKAMLIGIPNAIEQSAIAAFLDKKTALIDNAISIKEKQIELLKERQQVLIQQAVTRGLNPNVRFKDSGVDWIGEIPEHWEVVANRTLFRQRNEPGNENLAILSVSIHTAVSSEELSDDENLRGKIRIEEKSSYKLVKPGDIAYNMMRAWQGAIGAVGVEGMVSPAYVVAEAIGSIHAGFFEYQYRTKVFIQQMDRFSRGITDFRKRLYWGDFKQLKTVLPPLSEQVDILNFIDSIAKRTSNAISLKEKEIARLKEYKAILINSAVTGKIKVS